MEKLVAQEVEFQLAQLPEAMQGRIDRTDVEAWALNRLPARYATGKRGIKHVEQGLLTTHSATIVSVVRAGLQVVLRNDRPPGEPVFPAPAVESLSAADGEWVFETHSLAGQGD
jgi:hypothetical protein